MSAVKVSKATDLGQQNIIKCILNYHMSDGRTTTNKSLI